MKFEYSAGGVVVKKEKDKLWVLVIESSRYHHRGLPKGHIGDTIKGETKEEAALREVKEETGAQGTILRELNPITYFYSFEGEKRKKTVYFFLMRYTGGDITQHDIESENVEWISVDEIEQRLTYEDERKVCREARKYFDLLD
ncbi:MAG TPA: NUDIX domain-containing protein [Patescibacteria group bacterium]|nr:NUDIX domain-containing protein [Patescibacteria group bacterium]